MRITHLPFLRVTLFIVFCIPIFASPQLRAQFYKTKHYVPGATSDHDADLGILYNPQTYLISNVPTTYHGNQNVYATAYLPFIEIEYNPVKPIQLFGSFYTTAIALASPRDPAKGLYAPVQVVNTIPKSNILYPFASVVPSNANIVNFKGPFNGLEHLNDPVQGFVNPVPSEYGLTALETAQKFTKFSHEILTDQNGNGWDGFDKSGLLPIKLKINPVTGVSEYSPADDEITIFKNPLDLMSVTRTTIGHEIAHGIIDQTVNGNNGQISNTRRQLEEGFASMIGLGFSQWLKDPTFSNPDWNLFWEIPAMEPRWFNNPKSSGTPSTYRGEYYLENWQVAGYDEHDNGHVLTFVVAALNEGRSGFVDDDETRAPYNILPLVPGSKAETYKLVLRIFFRAFTQKLSPNAQYPDLRMATLAAAMDLGYPVGSHVFTQLVNAWDAVAVPATLYNKNCLNTTAETLLNGHVNFYAQKGTIFTDPMSEKVVELFDCSDSNPISTVLGPQPTDFIRDWNGDNVFSEDDNTLKSEIAVSTHAFTQVTKRWFLNKLGLNGMSGNGGFAIINQFGPFNDGAASMELLAEGANQYVKLKYPYSALSACRDEVSRNYFNGVGFYAKYDQIKVANSEDWALVYSGLSQIFSLAIKKDYEVLQQNPVASSIGTLYEEMSDPSKIIDFENPQSYGEPVVYHGINWNESQPAKNASILRKFFDLLVQGTEELGGYHNGEPDSPTYTIFPVKQDLVVKVLWTAFKNSPVDANLLEFRQATLEALHNIPPQYDGKSKEHIAFYDAWAAVLGLPDYASTLKYEPVAGSTAYPWTVKVGAEVEYPLYESQRLFEVSKSPKFNPNEFPVHQFVSNAAPDLATSMVYGLVNLEAGQTYYVHSRLSNAGDPRDGCAVTPDPVFCESLKTKKKWTMPFEFQTDKVSPVANLMPLADTEIPAWQSPFSWGSVKGASGYGLSITDDVANHLVQHEAYYDQDQPQTSVSTFLALSKEKKYTHTIAARQKLGSEWAVHVLPNGMLQPFTEDEIENRPYTYGPWTEPAMFFTSIPQIVPAASPVDGQHMPLLGEAFTLSASGYDGADGYTFEYQEPHYKSPVKDQPTFGFLISNVPGIKDQQKIQWGFTPIKEPVLPFITEQEKGATEWRTFVADMSLTPIPELNFGGPNCITSGASVTLGWKPVNNATHYRYRITEAGSDLELVNATTDQLSTPSIQNVSSYPAPGKYNWAVSAGIKNTNGEWLFGPEAQGSYGVRPPAPIALSPDNDNDVQLGSNGSVLFSWQSGPGQNLTQEHRFQLFKKVGNSLEVVPGFGNETIIGNQINVGQLEFNTSYQWKAANFTTISECGSATVANFKTQPEPEAEPGKPIESDLAFSLEEPTNDDFDMIIKTPSGNVFTYDDATRYVQDTQGSLGPDIAFFTTPEEGIYELTVIIYQRNHLDCPVTFTLTALENGAVKKVLGDNLLVTCENHFTGAEIGHFENGVATTFKYKYTK